MTTCRFPVFLIPVCCGSSSGASPARHPPAAGKPSAVSGSESGTQRYGLVQEFFRNVCSGRGQAGVPLPGERAQRDSLGVLGGVDEPKPECLSAGPGLGALAGLGGSNDNVTRIVNKRFMRHTTGEEMVSIMGGGSEVRHLHFLLTVNMVLLGLDI